MARYLCAAPTLGFLSFVLLSQCLTFSSSRSKVLKAAEVAFKETKILIFVPGSEQELLKVSPNGLV